MRMRDRNEGNDWFVNLSLVNAYRLFIGAIFAPLKYVQN